MIGLGTRVLIAILKVYKTLALVGLQACALFQETNVLRVWHSKIYKNIAGT